MTFAWSTVGTVHVNGVRLGLREAGDPAGAPVLLLHGSGSNARTWDRFAARLTAAGRRALAIDLRGHGTSARPGHYSLASIRDDVLDLLDRLSLRGAVLVGHSVGGYAALAAAQQAPERVGALILEDLAAPPRLRSPLNGFNPLQALAAAAGIFTARRDYELRAVGSILRQLTRPDAGWWARLSEVEQPTLILSGGPASCIPPARLAEVTGEISGARLATIPVGHRVHSLAPDQFAAETLRFLAHPHVPGFRPAAVAVEA
ncbi:alpha/beta hydrolase [Actinoplanes sp. NPDC051411]|uniref:alpha/beta fold hydrolase n=1 Tax=Actinoplanes sp. NPDC051411 TaxID=3155522 RepID=UPI003426D247